VTIEFHPPGVTPLVVQSSRQRYQPVIANTSGRSVETASPGRLGKLSSGGLARSLVTTKGRDPAAYERWKTFRVVHLLRDRIGFCRNIPSPMVLLPPPPKSLSLGPQWLLLLPQSEMDCCPEGPLSGAPLGKGVWGPGPCFSLSLLSLFTSACLPPACLHRIPDGSSLPLLLPNVCRAQADDASALGKYG
jgi:hypothetical protein